VTKIFSSSWVLRGKGGLANSEQIFYLRPSSADLPPPLHSFLREGYFSV
jgi:hypothetical protein